MGADELPGRDPTPLQSYSVRGTGICHEKWLEAARRLTHKPDPSETIQARMCWLSAYAEKSTVDGRSNHKRQVQEVLARSPRELPGVLLTVLPIIQRDNLSPLGHTPKPDGAMERFRLLEVLYDNWRGAPQRGFRGLGGAYALICALRTPYATKPRHKPCDT